MLVSFRSRRPRFAAILALHGRARARAQARLLRRIGQQSCRDDTRANSGDTGRLSLERGEIARILPIPGRRWPSLRRACADFARSAAPPALLGPNSARSRLTFDRRRPSSARIGQLWCNVAQVLAPGTPLVLQPCRVVEEEERRIKLRPRKPGRAWMRAVCPPPLPVSLIVHRERTPPTGFGEIWPSVGKPRETLVGVGQIGKTPAGSRPSSALVWPHSAETQIRSNMGKLWPSLGHLRPTSTSAFFQNSACFGPIYL